MEEFICEAIEPAKETWDVAGMTRGETGLPMRFTWRGREYAVAEVLERWKTTGPCRHGSGERYVRKHWFRIRTTDGSDMRLYCERRPRSAREATRRWWLYTCTPPEAPHSPRKEGRASAPGHGDTEDGTNEG